MKHIKKIIFIMAFLLLITIILNACNKMEAKEYFTYINDGSVSYLISLDNIKYMLVDYPNYYPDEINKQEDGILSRCSRGYIFQTSSDYCLFVENMRGGTPLFFYREDYDNELKMSTDNIDYIKIIFDDHNDTVLHITDDKNIRDLINSFYYGELIISNKIVQNNEIGTILFISNKYVGLVFSVRLYYDGETYYISNKGGAYLIPDGVINVTDIMKNINSMH